MYGIVAVSVLLMTMAAIGAFYSVDVWGHPLLVGALAAAVFLAALLVRRHRTKRHDAAHRFEYDNHRGGPLDDDEDVGATKG